MAGVVVSPSKRWAQRQWSHVRVSGAALRARASARNPSLGAYLTGSHRQARRHLRHREPRVPDLFERHALVGVMALRDLARAERDRFDSGVVYEVAHVATKRHAVDLARPPGGLLGGSCHLVSERRVGVDLGSRGRFDEKSRTTSSSASSSRPIRSCTQSRMSAPPPALCAVVCGHSTYCLASATRAFASSRPSASRGSARSWRSPASGPRRS